MFKNKGLQKIIKIFYIIICSIKMILCLPFKIIGFMFNKILILLRFSISFKLTFVYTILFLIMFSVLNTCILFGTNLFITKYVKEDLKSISSYLSEHISSLEKIDEERIKVFEKIGNVNIDIYDEKSIYTKETSDIENIEEKDQKISYSIDIDMNKHKTYRAVSSIIDETKKRIEEYLSETEVIYIGNKKMFLKVSKNITEAKGIFILMMILLVSMTFIGILMTILIGKKISRKLLMPIYTMTDTVKDISVYNLNKRLDVHGSKDELKDLAITFNDMMDNIQKSYEKQNQFVSDASHELRTPIAVIQGYANMLDRWGKNDISVLQESIDAIKSEASNMKELIEKLLFLARSDTNTASMEKEEIYLGELLLEIIKETQMLDSKHTIESNIDDPGKIIANKKAIKQALRIFIDNSIKFTPENGTIQMKIIKTKKHTQLIIEDTGVGISKEDIPYIFDRFYRADKSRTKESGGNGLGLSIAKWILDKHNILLQVHSEVNVGTKMILDFPKYE